MILYVNSCVRDESRTDRLARALLEKLSNETHDEIQEVKLEKEFLNGKLQPLTKESLKKRDDLLEAADYADPFFDYARQFSQADTVVVSAPFWDASVPAILRTYLENIYAIGIVTKHDENGAPVGLCRAKKLYYVTTVGAEFFPDFSYNYVAALATQIFGIPETELIKAEMLDVDGYDAEKIVVEAIQSLE